MYCRNRSSGFGAELTEIPAEFVLYGDTAIALHLGHRQSVDFDFFSDPPFDHAKLTAAIPFMATATITQRAPNTLSVIVDRDGPVKLSFFGVPGIARLAPPHIAPDNGLRIASLLDLAGTKHPWCSSAPKPRITSTSTRS